MVEIDMRDLHQLYPEAAREIVRLRAEIDHLEAQPYQGATDEIGHHGAAEAGIPADHCLWLVRLGGFLHQLAESCGVFHHIKGRKAFAGSAADGAADTGNGTDQCHALNCYWT